jgi:hypothetical protein
MPRPFAGRVKEQKASSTRAKEILNVASDLSCNPTRRSTSQPMKVHGRRCIFSTRVARTYLAVNRINREGDHP